MRTKRQIPGWAIIVLALAVALVAIITIATLHQSADKSRQAEIMLFRLDILSHELDALEWHFERTSDTKLLTEVKDIENQTIQTLDGLMRLDPGEGRLQQIRKTQLEFEAAMDEMFKFILAGDFKNADALDKERVDPAFDALSGLLDNASTAYSERAQQIERASEIGSAVIAITAGIVIGILLLQFQKIQQRAELMAVEQKVLRKARDDLEKQVQERTSELAKTNDALKAEIQERKRAEEALRESEEKYRVLFEAAPIGIGIADFEGKVLDANKSIQEMTGFTLEELSSIDIGSTYVDPNKRRLLLKTLQEAGRVRDWEVRLKRKDGAIYYALLSADLLELRGRKVLLTTARNITERKRIEDELRQRTEELARSNAELEQFAYVASHDLREPLRMVSGFTQLLARHYKGRLDKSADEFIGYIVGGATRMQRMVDDLLSYSRIGMYGKPLEPTDCEAVLDQVLTNLKVAIEQNNAVVTHDPLPTVMADMSQMVQLFQNLISNSIRYRGAETPRIHVSAERKEDDWVFSARDNGRGIAPEFFRRLFQLFQREHPEREYSGTGIGLAICKRIVERHGGRIWAESEVGKGSIFYFTIPAIRRKGRD
jgi:PAS domain S-box-containing protein